MKVAAIGDNCVDVYEAEGKSYPGGNPVNVAVYLRRMNVNASYTGVVGNDVYGQTMIDALKNKGVDVSHVRIEEGSTAITKVSIVDGNRVFGDYIEGVMEHFCPTQDDVDFLCEHDLVVSGIWGHAESCLKQVHDSGTTVVFDYSDQPQDPLVDQTIGNVDYAFFGLELKDGPELRSFLAEKQKLGPKAVIATLGDQGSVLYDGTNYVTHGIIECPIADTMGAGDSFIAGFITGVLNNDDLYTCMDKGAQSSAVTLGYSGAW